MTDEELEELIEAIKVLTGERLEHLRATVTKCLIAESVVATHQFVQACVTEGFAFDDGADDSPTSLETPRAKALKRESN